MTPETLNAKFVEDRERYFARLQPLLSFRDLTLVELAYKLAKEGLRPHTRKGEKDEEGNPIRAFEHARRVSLILIDEVGCVLVALIIVALLHDGDEDTRFLKIPVIEVIFGTEIASIVRMLSKLDLGPGVKDEGYTDRLIKYGCWMALLIKCCDRIDNLRSLAGCDLKFIAKQVEETRSKYLAVFDLCVERVPKRYRKGALHLQAECIKLLGRYEEMLRAAEHAKKAFSNSPAPEAS